MEKTIEKYLNKILGIRNYKSGKKDFGTTDFLDNNILADFLAEVQTGESDITPAGKSFLEVYYGFDSMSKILSKNTAFINANKNFSDVESIKKWLENITPMETFFFIEKARGNLKQEQTLREDLLPPK